MGTETLARRLGRRRALQALTDLLVESVKGPDLAHSPWREVLLDIGDGHAERLLYDTSGTRLAYWPRAWAARSLAYLGDDLASTALKSGLSDQHWRVRMNSASALGRLQVTDANEVLRRALGDPHPRVRHATVLALQRVGDESAIGDLARLLRLSDGADTGNIERAINAIERRG